MKICMCAMFLISAAWPAAAQSGSNGIYGGYIGSDRWFTQMRQSAANQAVLASLGRSGGRGALPPDYVEFAGLIRFPGGNPFPKKRLPDLRIVCRDPQADSVERTPWIDESDSFYTVFKKGQTYDLYWMYYFGSREKFGSVTVAVSGPERRSAVFDYTVKAAESEPVAPPAPTSSWREVAGLDPDAFDLSGLPKKPRNFEEQKILDAIQSAQGRSADPALKADAHSRLAGYYEKQGDAERARRESQRARFWRERGR